MSDEIEFEGGIFGDAGVDLNDIPDDPFDFGTAFWPIRVIGVGEAKVTGKGDKIGAMIKWAVEHPKYDGHPVSEKLGNGNWQRLPVPRALQNEIPWDPRGNPDDKKVLIDLRDLYLALGFSTDQMAGIKLSDLVGTICLAKINPKKTPEGFWQFNIFAHKPYDPNSEEAQNSQAAQNVNSGGKSAEDLAAEELARELG
ncbi:hypothetical protein [Streptomyces sp. NPDC048720]|uniref:hypothetical protein n=1 Tax=Streptomyces sp. NPDC048720 TaxID=3365588 RepID=UPI0037133190